MAHATTPQHRETKHHPDPDRTNLNQEARIDKELEETFPASDATPSNGVTKIGADGKEKGGPKDKEHPEHTKGRS